MTLLARANEFRTKAEMVRDREADIGELKRIKERTEELESSLDDYEALLTTAGVIAGLPLGPVISADIDDGFQAFHRKIAANNFMDRSFVAATNKLKSASSELKNTCSKGWKDWAGQRLRVLSEAWPRVAFLRADEHRDAVDQRKRLEKIASTEPTPSAVTLFTTIYDHLWKRLDTLPLLSGELAEVLELVKRKPPLTLADLTDEQLRLLRESEVGAQIELHRRES